MRMISMPRKVIRRPVGAAPRNTPRWVPAAVQRMATVAVAVSTTRSSVVVSKSGNAAKSSATPAA